MDLEEAGAECSKALLVGFTATTGDVTSCVTGPELVAL